jgi:DNA-binding NtrC family response regulator
LNGQRVLAITKRTAELNSTQSLLYREGFELVTATSMTAARCVIKSVAVRGVFVCRDSWSEQERENIISEFAVDYPEVTIIMRCAKCTRPTHLSKALSDLLTCAKKPASVPTEGKSPATTYIFCLDCGKRIPYESKRMKAVESPKHGNRCA